MSLANKMLKPIPSENGSGQYQDIENLHGNIKRVTRRFLVNGKSIFPDTVESIAFDTYGTLDGQTTAPAKYRQVPHDQYIFPNCYLETQTCVNTGRNSVDYVVTKIYHEAYSTVREIRRPVAGVDENGRKTLQRTFVILNTATDANRNPPIGTTQDSGGGNLWLRNQQSTIGNAVTIITRNFIEATTEEVQVGGDTVTLDDDGRELIQRQFIQLASEPYTKGAIGSTATIGGETYVLVRERKTENGAVRNIQREYLNVNSLPFELGSPSIVPERHTDGTNCRTVTRRYLIDAANAATFLLQLSTATTPVTDPVFTSAHLVEQNIRGLNKSVAILTRVWSEIPTSHNVPQSIPFTFPGMIVRITTGVWARVRRPFSKTVTASVKHDYFLIDPPAGTGIVDLDAAIPEIERFKVLSNYGSGIAWETDEVVDVSVPIFDPRFVQTTPSYQTYVSYITNDTPLVGRDSTVSWWRGNIAVRRTPYIKAQ